MLRGLKLKLFAMAPPAVFLCLTGYFAWNAVHGNNGLQAQLKQRAALASAQQSYKETDAQRAVWEAKVNALSDKSIAPDMLDAQARTVLNLANQRDIVVNLQDNSLQK